MIKINLLGDALAQGPQKKGPEKTEAIGVYADTGGRASFPIAGVLTGLVFASSGFIYYLWLNTRIEKATIQRNELQVERDKYKKFNDLANEFKKVKENLIKKEGVILDLKKQQHLPVYFMQELLDSIPDGVTFRTVIQDGKTIRIDGDSRTIEAIEQFRLALAGRSKWMKDIQYPTHDKVGELYTFKMSFELINAVEVK